jgi:ribonuclease P protein component
MDETFGKEHRIFLKKEIDHVFTMNEKVHVFPFLSHISLEPSDNPSFAVLITVPKKRFKKAHDRNRIKRLIRESLRREKAPLLAHAARENLKILFSIVYLWEEIPADDLIEQKIKKLISRICELS